MKRWRIENGKLILKPWSFTAPDCRYPHRSYTVAFHKEGRTQFQLISNHPRSRWWITAIGPGFAGDHSKAINPVSTAIRKIADQWRELIEAGKVQIEEKQTHLTYGTTKPPLLQRLQIHATTGPDLHLGA
jgi:hypothetical protein